MFVNFRIAPSKNKKVVKATMQYEYLTDIGKTRSINEDAVLLCVQPFATLMLVADGMGGHAAGDIASQMVISAFDESFTPDVQFETAEACQTWLTEQIVTVNTAILKEANALGTGVMGTTLVAAVICETFTVFANIGDSRAYLMAYTEMRQITKDHTFVRGLVESGQLSERAAKMHPQKNIVSKALGTEAQAAVDLFVLEAMDFESILLCTDGLTGEVEDDVIADVLADSTLTTLAKVTKLIHLANEAGGSDNITAILGENK